MKQYLFLNDCRILATSVNLGGLMKHFLFLAVILCLTIRGAELIKNPTRLRGEQRSGSENVYLSWDKPKCDERYLKGYLIYRKQSLKWDGEDKELSNYTLVGKSGKEMYYDAPPRSGSYYYAVTCMCLTYEDNVFGEQENTALNYDNTENCRFIIPGESLEIAYRANEIYSNRTIEFRWRRPRIHEDFKMIAYRFTNEASADNFCTLVDKSTNVSQLSENPRWHLEGTSSRLVDTEGLVPGANYYYKIVAHFSDGYIIPLGGTIKESCTLSISQVYIAKDYFPLRLNHFWVYLEGGASKKKKIISVDKGAYYTQMNRDQAGYFYKYYSDSVGGIYDVTFSTGEQRSSVLELPDRFSAGTTSAKSSEIEWEILLANDVVTVKAGTFSNCVVKKYISRMMKSNPDEWTMYAYYAKGVGMVLLKRQNGAVVTELESFGDE